MWHLLHGPNDIARDEEIARMKTKMGDAELAALNTTSLDAFATLREIQSACNTVSFLADHRMVIVRNWFSKPGTSKRKPAKEVDDPVQQLVAYLAELPESTALVLVEDGELPDSHPLVKLGKEKSTNGRVKLFELPPDTARWLIDRARHKGGELSPQAAQALAGKINRGDKYDRDHYAEDTRLYLRKLDNELDKLVAYATGRRIEPADIDLLVADEDISEMFKFIDAVSVRDGGAAFRLMRGILARGESPGVILTMLARQTRLMICAKEYERLPVDQLAEAIHVHTFVAKKVEQQARRFSMHELERAHLAIAKVDRAVKTGRLDDVTALDLLVGLFCSGEDAWSADERQLS